MGLLVLSVRPFLLLVFVARSGRLALTLIETSYEVLAPIRLTTYLDRLWEYLMYEKPYLSVPPFHPCASWRALTMLPLSQAWRLGGLHHASPVPFLGWLALILKQHRLRH